MKKAPVTRPFDLRGLTLYRPNMTSSDARALLLKETTYRLSYRGMLELDTICRKIIPQLESMDDADIQAVRDLFLQKEGDLWSWLVENNTPPEEWTLPVALVKYLVKHASAA